MSDDLDWLSIVNGSPVIPAELIEIRSKSDQAFLQNNKGELQRLSSELSADLYTYCRISLGVHGGVLRRQFAAALSANEPIEHCLQLFQELTMLGFTSPVDKARLVVILLTYLETRLPRDKLQLIADAMATELVNCRTACDENLNVLRTFQKA